MHVKCPVLVEDHSQIIEDGLIYQCSKCESGRVIIWTLHPSLFAAMSKKKKTTQKQAQRAVNHLFTTP